MSVVVSSFRRRSRRSDEIEEWLTRCSREAALRYRRLRVLLEREGERVNHKRLYRVYREAGLCLRRKRRKRCVRIGLPRVLLTAANQKWALGFTYGVVVPDARFV